MVAFPTTIRNIAVTFWLSLLIWLETQGPDFKTAPD
jgi:hypothetical protein